MQFKEFLDKVDLDTLHHRLLSEMNVDAELTVEADSDFDDEFLLEVKIFNHLIGMKIAERIDFKIFTKLERFDYLSVTLPNDCMIDRIDRLVQISRIVEDHVKSALNS